MPRGMLFTGSMTGKRMHWPEAVVSEVALALGVSASPTTSAPDERSSSVYLFQGSIIARAWSSGMSSIGRSSIHRIKGYCI